jgi:hypothetical protein
MPRRVLLAFTLLFSFTSVVSNGAQLNTSVSKQTQGIPGTLSGTVHNKRNDPVKDVRIELLPVAGLTGTAVSTYSAPDGSFVFSDLSYGKYVLTATLGISGTSQEIVVNSSQDWVSVEIDLGVASKDATVSVAELKVPLKARKELEKARHAFSHQKLADADRYVAKALLAWPHYCQALTLRAILALNRNSYEQASVDAENAIEYDPNDSSAYVVLGDSYILLNRLDDAQRAVDRSIEIKPNAWEGHYDKGRILVIRHDWPGALREVSKAASLKTEDDPYLHLLKAVAFAGMNDQVAAKNEVDAFRRLKPESSWSAHTRRLINDIGFPAIGNSDQPIVSGSRHANSP